MGGRRGEIVGCTDQEQAGGVGVVVVFFFLPKAHMYGVKREPVHTHTPLCNLATLHSPANTHVQPGINNLTEAGRHNWAGL